MECDLKAYQPFEISPRGLFQPRQARGKAACGSQNTDLLRYFVIASMRSSSPLNKSTGCHTRGLATPNRPERERPNRMAPRPGSDRGGRGVPDARRTVAPSVSPWLCRKIPVSSMDIHTIVLRRGEWFSTGRRWRTPVDVLVAICLVLSPHGPEKVAAWIAKTGTTRANSRHCSMHSPVNASNI